MPTPPDGISLTQEHASQTVVAGGIAEICNGSPQRRHLCQFLVGTNTKRGMQAIEDHGILPNYAGTLVHGCWAPYWSLNCEHSLCGAHLVR